MNQLKILQTKFQQKWTWNNLFCARYSYTFLLAFFSSSCWRDPKLTLIDCKRSSNWNSRDIKAQIATCFCNICNLNVTNIVQGLVREYWENGLLSWTVLVDALLFQGKVSPLEVNYFQLRASLWYWYWKTKQLDDCIDDLGCLTSQCSIHALWLMWMLQRS